MKTDEAIPLEAMKPPGNLLKRLWMDPALGIALAVWLISVISYLFPAPDEFRPGFELTATELILLIMAIILFLQAGLRLNNKGARTFWFLLAAAFACWVVGRLSGVLVPNNPIDNLALLVDVLYLGYYALVIVAIELRLEARNRPLWSLNYGTAAATGVLMVLAIFSYFSLIPYLAGSKEYQSYFYLYAALDLYLALRLVIAAVGCREKSWSRAYWVLAVTFALVALADVLSWLYREEYLEYRRDRTLNMTWNLWCPAAYLASRIVLQTSDISASAVRRIYPAANTILLFGLALPIVHLAGYGFGLFDLEAATHRDVFVFFWILAVASILLLFHWLMRRRIVELADENDRARVKALDLEAQLERSLVMGTLGRLSAGLAHDFGNTVAAINMHAKIIAAKSNVGDIDRRDIEGINLGVRYAHELIEKLRVFGSADRRSTAGSLDLALAVRNTMQLVRPSIDAKVALTFGGSVARAFVFADEADVHRVLVNYLYNAIDAVGEDGEIAVDVRKGQVHDICASCGSRFAGRYVTLTVSDNGKGIDSALAGRLFEPLITSKAAGTGGGLGLATVHGIVHRLGGHVGLSTSPMGGCCFSASFVAAEGQLEQ